MAKRAEILDRLRGFLNDRGRGGFVALYKSGTFPEGTVKSWQQGRNVPGLEHAARLGKRYNLSLDWLVTGKGPELRGETQQATDTARALRAHLVAVLKPEVGGVAEALPSADAILADVEALYRERLAAIVRDRRRRAVDATLSKVEATDGQAAAQLTRAILKALNARHEAGVEAYAEPLAVSVDPAVLAEVLGMDGERDLFGGGGATPEWNVPALHFTPAAQSRR